MMSGSEWNADKLVLLAEDRDEDANLLRLAFRRAQIWTPIFVVRDGAECIGYLSGHGKYADRKRFPLPVLLMLDLKMPQKNGFEVLQWVRQQTRFKQLPVIVLTVSQDIYDMRRAYELGANSFFVKTLDIQSLADLAEQIREYWLHVVTPSVGQTISWAEPFQQLPPVQTTAPEPRL